MQDYEIQLRRLGLGHPNILLKPKQIEVLDEIRKGTLETVAILPTGYGKSLIYQLAPLILDGTVIVFSSLSVIQEEQVKQLKNSEANEMLYIKIPGGRLLTAGNEENIQDLKCDIDTSDISNCNLIFAHPEAFFCTSEGNDLLESSRKKNNFIENNKCDFVEKYKIHELEFENVFNTQCYNIIHLKYK
ncbi:recQ [Mytilus edulis]|uniref:RecQ n=1 Tax=Mytilus edulis TaxID=6550 RepID=A0A8S3QFB8_MYTED|nr:recQ [Mytilus edulis]